MLSVSLTVQRIRVQEKAADYSADRPQFSTVDADLISNVS